MAEKEHFQHGGVAFPLSRQDTSVRVADPTLFFALDFFRFVLDKYIGERLVDQAGILNLSSVQRAVATTVPWNPADFMLTTQFKFPLLAMYRKRTKYSDRTLGYRFSDTAAELIYVLPPIQAGHADALLPLLHAVVATIDNRLELGFDPGYAPPGRATGESVWDAGASNVMAIELVGASFGEMQGSGELTYPAALMELGIRERNSIGPIPDAYPAFEGADVAVDHQPNTGNVTGTDEGPLLEDVADDTLDFDLAITTVSPSSGTVVGGTSVTITGTGFTSDCIVRFGGKRAAVTASSSTTITCTSPSYDWLPSSVDVTVINRLNQSATKQDGFTYV